MDPALEGIAPDGSRIGLLVTDASRASLVEVRLGAGQTTRPVRHRTVEEIWYFTSGRGRVWRQLDGARGGETLQVIAGSVLTIPVGCSFQFAAEAGAELTFLCFTSPPWPGPEEALAIPLGGLGRATV